MPPPAVGARLSEHPALQRADHPDLLGKREKIPRRQQAAARMIPPQQRLEPDDHPVAEPNGRLVMEHELAPLQRVPQVGLEVHPVADGRMLRRLVSLVSPLSARLGRIESNVRIPHQVLSRVQERSRPGDPDAEPHDHLALLHLERSSEMLEDALRQADWLIVVENGFHQDPKLVGADPRHHVAGRHDLPKPAPDHAQDVVTRTVPEGIVEQLEVIDVEGENGDGAPRRAALQRLVDLVAKGDPVREVRDGVVGPQVGEPLLHLLAVGHVADVQHQRLRTRAVEQVRDRHLAVGPAAEFVAEPAVDADRQRRRCQSLLQAGRKRSAVRWMQELAEWLTYELGRGIGEKPVDRGADEAHHALGIGEQHDVTRVLHQ